MHSAVRRISTAEVMTFHKAREPATLADSDHIHLIERLEFIYKNTVAKLQFPVAATL